jgi:hypothetical protein
VLREQKQSNSLGHTLCLLLTAATVATWGLTGLVCQVCKLRQQQLQHPQRPPVRRREAVALRRLPPHATATAAATATGRRARNGRFRPPATAYHIPTPNPTPPPPISGCRAGRNPRGRKSRGRLGPPPAPCVGRGARRKCSEKIFNFFAPLAQQLGVVYWLLAATHNLPLHK